MANDINYEGVEQLPLREFTEKAYLDYSMYVILDRALPHIGDGLKPVQRRIIYAMSDLGLSAGAKPKKSARTVGDVIGKFHPHGDSACYEAMVLMAQPFSFRYPLIHGQGNWGSPDDPKSFAAMRYTECKLTAYSQLLLSELGHGTTDWQANFDGTLKEPTLLPARLPNILLNGGTGIAVGMATDVPPHNLREVANACIRLLEDDDAGLDQVLEHIKGPDLPTGGEIVSSPDDIRKLYETGNGSYRVRARYEMEGTDIVITELPYQVSGSKILTQIADQMRAKKLPMVDDLRDESDHENPTRLVICARSNRVDIDSLLQHLFATTDLERSYRVNLNMIGLDGRPQVKNLLLLLREWLRYRTETVRRRLQYRLEKVEQRLHILAGLLVAFLNIDEVIAIIRYEDEPKTALMRRFELSDTQAEAILELKLRHLAKLEEMKIRGEQEELEKERKQLQAILGSKTKLKRLISKEITEAATQFGDDRRSPIVSRIAAQALDDSALTPSDPITVIISEKGWIRAAKGHEVDAENLNYKSGDQYLCSAAGRSNQPLIVFDQTGRGYSLTPHTLPSARSQGEPISGKVNAGTGAEFRTLIIGPNEQRYLLTSDAGYGFIAKIGSLVSRNKAGKAVVTVGDAQLRPALLAPAIEENADANQQPLLAIISTVGRLLIFPLADVPELARGKGNKLIGIKAAEFKDGSDAMTHTVILQPGQHLMLTSGQRTMGLKPRDIEAYSGDRGSRGKPLPRGYRKVSAAWGEKP